MTFYVDNETTYIMNPDLEKKMNEVILETVKQENFTYSFELSLQITDNNGIKEYNSSFRNIDRETDVLSFPNLDFTEPGIYSCLESSKNRINYLNLDTEEIVLGNIILSYEKVVEQALEYGHSETREFCFLIAHSMLHLLGYDHMEANEAKIMEEKQEKILRKLGITKDIF